MFNPTRHTAALLTLAGLLAVLFTAAPARALDAEHREKAEAALEKAFTYLRQNQNDDGSWSPKPGPAITALIAAGMLSSPGIDREDPAVAKALDYILARQKDDGGIYDRILANYNTSIALMALGRVRNTDSRINKTVEKAQDFLRGLQWDGQKGPDGKTIDENHPYYGGAGYGGSGRPDLSNTATLIAGLNDSGLICTDPAYKRAMVFIERLQGTSANTKYNDQIEPNGGFIYATSHNKDRVGELESKAGTIVDSTGKSRLRTYGSMTYAGFMSYLYAQLDRDDPRVQDALKWVTHNYTLDQNPGMVDNPDTPQDETHQGYYYYLHMFARAMHAWGDPVVTDGDGNNHDWSNELIDKLVSLQNDDGSWINDAHDRWAESDPNLATAYAILALQYALQ